MLLDQQLPGMCARKIVGVVGLKRRSSVSSGGEAASVERPVVLQAPRKPTEEWTREELIACARESQRQGTESQAVSGGGGVHSTQPALTPESASPVRGISSWTVEEVLAFLDRCQLGEWKDVFRKRRITGFVLAHYKAEELVEDFVSGTVCLGVSMCDCGSLTDTCEQHISFRRTYLRDVHAGGDGKGSCACLGQGVSSAAGGGAAKEGVMGNTVAILTSIHIGF